MKYKLILQAPLTHIDTIKRFKFLIDSLDIKKNESILSIGVGSGFETYICSYYSNSSIGIDISEKQIKLLKDSIHLENVNFYCVDATKLPPKNFVNTFDKCICMDVIEHVENPEKIINFAKKVLTRNGVMAITFPINIDHGLNRFSYGGVNELLKKSKLEYQIKVVNERKISLLTTFLCNFFQRIIYPPKEANIFDELTCYKLLNNPKKIHYLFKIGIATLFKICSNSYKIDKNGKRVFIIAKKNQ
ncbi:MAG: class I SAM-dependent methyltransferase [Candidatus Methanofastidiosa archaeon]|nr:class I SAM-dependent methyltransferase [Candidatus Methanofastidiosa archaeon]